MSVSKWMVLLSKKLCLIDNRDRREAIREQFEERAAICEYEGGMNRTDAEHAAFAEVDDGNVA